jgi:hypothetical protein
MTAGNARRHIGLVACTVGTAADMMRGFAAIGSSSRRTSPIACHLLRACFSRHRFNRSISRGGTSGASLVKSGSRARTDARMSVAVSPANGGRPVRTSYSTTPNEKTSLR